MSISLCMIVKNEAECLPRALASWRDLADELVIVDTGSTDATVAIAEAHGARVLRYDWQLPGHKGEARNVGLDAATGDWIVVLDADEVIIDPAMLRATLLTIPPEPAVSAVNVLFHNMEGDSVALAWYQNRVFRRGMYRYVHREHEIPTATAANVGIIGTCDALIEHRPPARRASAKVGPMLERLRLDVEERPDDPHSLYMYARQLGHAERYTEALACIERYMAMPHAGLKPDAARVAGICCDRMGNRLGMYDWFHRATAHEPRRRLLWVELAHMYHADKDPHMALNLATLALSLPIPPQQREVQPVELTAHIAELIDVCRAHAH